MTSNESSIRADFHSHTTRSDGSLSPTELVEAAAKRGITHLAITDHDTTAALHEAGPVAQRLGLTLVPGVEITCEAAGTEVHLLGLGVEPGCEALQALCVEMTSRRLSRFMRMVEQLRAFGLALELPELPANVALSRPFLARMLVEQRHASDIEHAFERYLRRGCPGYVAHRREPVRAAIDAVHQARGVAILAHPGIYRNTDECVEEALEQGADGIECFHPDHEESKQRRLFNRARSHGLLISGGADYHGPGHARSHFFGKKFCPPNEAVRIRMAAAARSERAALW